MRWRRGVPLRGERRAGERTKTSHKQTQVVYHIDFTQILYFLLFPTYCCILLLLEWKRHIALCLLPMSTQEKCKIFFHLQERLLRISYASSSKGMTMLSNRPSSVVGISILKGIAVTYSMFLGMREVLEHAFKHFFSFLTLSLWEEAVSLACPRSPVAGAPNPQPRCQTKTEAKIDWYLF